MGEGGVGGGERLACTSAKISCIMQIIGELKYYLEAIVYDGVYEDTKVRLREP